MLKGRKKGTVSVELGMGIALASVVVVIALTMVTSSLKTIASTSEMNNMFNKSATAFSKDGRNFNSHVVNNTQENSQIMGEQGNDVEIIIEHANEVITDLSKKDELSDTEILNLAKQLTALALANGNTSSALSGNEEVMDKYNIKLKNGYTFAKLSQTIKSVEWYDNETQQGCMDITACSDNAKSIKLVMSWFKISG